MKKRTQIILRVCIALVVVALGIIAFWQMNVMAERDTNERLVAERRAINSLFNHSDRLFHESFSFVTKKDASGRLYTTCALNEELEAFLGVLVDAYNADPSTKLKVVEEELRLWLTEDIVKSISGDTEEPALKEFIYWIGAPADLVDKVTGEDANLKGTATNYDFVKDPDYNPNNIYRRDYEASK